MKIQAWIFISSTSTLKSLVFNLDENLIPEYKPLKYASCPPILNKNECTNIENVKNTFAKEIATKRRKRSAESNQSSFLNLQTSIFSNFFGNQSVSKSSLNQDSESAAEDPEEIYKFESDVEETVETSKISCSCTSKNPIPIRRCPDYEISCQIGYTTKSCRNDFCNAEILQQIADEQNGETYETERALGLSGALLNRNNKPKSRQNNKLKGRQLREYERSCIINRCLSEHKIYKKYSEYEKMKANNKLTKAEDKKSYQQIKKKYCSKISCQGLEGPDFEACETTHCLSESKKAVFEKQVTCIFDVYQGVDNSSVGKIVVGILIYGKSQFFPTTTFTHVTKVINLHSIRKNLKNFAMPD